MDEQNMMKISSLEIKEAETTRAVLYNLFAILQARKVDDTCLNPHFQQQLQFGLPDSEGKTQVLSALEKARYDSDYYRELQLDYDRLFCVPGPNLTFPYESCYTHRNIDGTFGRLWQEPARDMQRILKEWKIEFAEGWDLIPDHIAVELFFMAELCHRRANAKGTDDGEAIRNWQINFFHQHLSPWVFEFLNRLEEKAETAFYRGGAKLLREFLTEEKVDFDSNKVE